MPVYHVLEQPGTQKALAAATLYLLKKTAFFLKASVSQFDGDNAFEKMSDVTVARPKLTGEAEDYNPRSGIAALSEEVDYVRTTVKLEKLFTRGTPVYSTDPSQSRYIKDFSEVACNAIRLGAENYLYNKIFREYLIPPTGIYRYGANAPVQVTWRESATGSLLPMARQLLSRSAAVLQRQEVPASDLFAAISPDAAGDMLATLPSDELTTGALSGGTELMRYGLPEGVFIQRYGFSVGASTSVQGQVESRLVNSQIASAVADTNFIQDDHTVSTPIGAVAITCTTNFGSPIGAGQIVRIGATGVSAIAYGVVLRAGVNSVVLVPYGFRGEVLTAAQITAAIGTGLRVTVPSILSVCPAYHREHSLFASRKLIEPGMGAGAVSETVADRMSGMVLQNMRGSYSVDNFRSSARTSMLMGGTPTDHRKAVLMLCG